jgi:hypothetical protein
MCVTAAGSASEKTDARFRSAPSEYILATAVRPNVPLVDVVELVIRMPSKPRASAPFATITPPTRQVATAARSDVRASTVMERRSPLVVGRSRPRSRSLAGSPGLVSSRRRRVRRRDGSYASTCLFGRSAESLYPLARCSPPGRFGAATVNVGSDGTGFLPYRIVCALRNVVVASRPGERLQRSVANVTATSA